MAKKKNLRKERSAGVVVFRRRSSGGNDDLEYLLLDYGKHWDYPKGHVKKGETDLDAALRELAEETGIEHVDVLPGFAREIAYFFRHPKRGLIRKEVIFFLAQTRARRIKLSHEHVGYEFLPFEAAIGRLTFVSARHVLRDAHEFLHNCAADGGSCVKSSDFAGPVGKINSSDDIKGA